MTDMAFGDWGRRPSLSRIRLPRGRRAPLLLLAVALLVMVSAAIVLVHALSDEASASGQPTFSPPPSAPAWIDIPKPVQIFSLDVPGFTDAPVAYTARRRTVVGGREDDLAFGALGGPKPALRLRIARAGTEPLDQAPLYAVLAVRAADADRSVARVGLPDLIRTRFGDFEVADVALSGATPQAPEAPCGGFRRATSKDGLAISGIACGGAKAISRKQLGCLIDRLDLASAGEDRALIDMFARSELHRDPACLGLRLAPETVAMPDDKPVAARTSAKPRRRHPHRR